MPRLRSRPLISNQHFRFLRNALKKNMTLSILISCKLAAVKAFKTAFRNSSEPTLSQIKIMVLNEVRNNTTESPVQITTETWAWPLQPPSQRLSLRQTTSPPFRFRFKKSIRLKSFLQRKSNRIRLVYCFTISTTTAKNNKVRNNQSYRQVTECRHVSWQEEGAVWARESPQ